MRTVNNSDPESEDMIRDSVGTFGELPLYNIKYESKIEDFVETIDNPFDSNPGNMEGFTPGRDRLRTKRRSK